MANKAKIRAVAFVSQQIVKPMLKDRYKLKEFEICKMIIAGVKPLQEEIPDGEELFARIERLSPKFIINPEVLTNQSRDDEGYYVYFDNDIEWVLSPKDRIQIGQRS